MTSQPGFIERVEARIEALEPGVRLIDMGTVCHAIAEELAESKPVAWISPEYLTAFSKQGFQVSSHQIAPTLLPLFTHPAPSELAEAQGRIADSRGETYYQKYLLLSAQYTREVEALTDQLAAAQAALTEVRGCFDAALSEGLLERLAELDVHDVGSLADLVHRRLMYAHAAAITDQPANGIE